MRDETKTKAELVTELRAIRKMLAEQSSRLDAHLAPRGPRDPSSLHQTVLETLRALLIERDEEGRLTYVSSSVTEILGYQPEEVLGNLPSDWMPFAEAPAEAELEAAVIAPYLSRLYDYGDGSRRLSNEEFMQIFGIK